METRETTEKPRGTLWMSSFLCGGLGALLAVVVSLTGLLAPAREYVVAAIVDWGFADSETWQVGERVEWGIAVGSAFCVAFFVLDSAALWRRLLILLFCVTLSISSVLTLGLVGGVFVPFTLLIAILASALSAILYASQHRMPCELGPEAHVNESRKKASPAEFASSGSGSEREGSAQPMATTGKTRVEETLSPSEEEGESPDPLKESPVEELVPSSKLVPMPNLGKSQKANDTVVVKVAE